MSDFEEVLKQLRKEHYKEIDSLNSQLDKHIENEIRLADKINEALELLKNSYFIDDEGYHLIAFVNAISIEKILKGDEDEIRRDNKQKK